MCGDGNAFMGLDDQSLMARLIEKDDIDYVELDLEVSRSHASVGSHESSIDTITRVNEDEMSYISSKELATQINLLATVLILPSVVEQAVIPVVTESVAPCLVMTECLATAPTTVSACTTATITTVEETFMSSPITMASTMQATTSLVSTSSITRQINMVPPVSVESTIGSRTTLEPTIALQGVHNGRGDQRMTKKVDKLKVSTYIWTNAVDFNRKGTFGVSSVHLHAYKGKPIVPGLKSMTALDSAYLGEFAGNYQFSGQTLRWVVKKHWPNGSLNTWLDKDPKRKIVDENAARYITIRLIEAVQYLHSKGFCHGNIHPNNIYINDKGQSVLGGLGAAIKYNGMRSLRADKEYDFKFFSPELLTGPCMHRSSDIFSVGSVAFFVISGRYPFRTKEDLINLEYEPEYSMDFSLHAELFLYQCLE
ncbi:hypothetical protein CHS0354_006048 [Potamilus streckersoni]|uniref:non-specific serine/threonine protein kinase n=1 Tax=Potamilus streckersoni TaxID=2493646 RepID=A0AAE0S324_9BIVA|nr:hypothetical protein CHS0354_006048 [Potamilus streckersoni]